MKLPSFYHAFSVAIEIIMFSRNFTFGVVLSFDNVLVSEYWV